MGKWIILYFYPRDNTPSCSREACSFRDNLSKLQEIAVTLGVSSQNLESHQKFSNKFKLNFPILVDKEKTIINLYGADGILMPKRVTFLINPKGIVKKIYQNIKVDHHLQEIIKNLQEFTN